MKTFLFDLFMPLVPKNELSHWVGRLAHRRLPEPVGSLSVSWFAKYYKINMAEAEYPLEHYKTVGELFTRRLKPGARPLAAGPVVHPVDAKITEAGRIEKLTLIQAKGKSYQVDELIRSRHYAEAFEGGQYLTYYLCPTDYHRVHAPVSGKIVWSAHVPGELWPVNEWSVSRVPKLFSVNERVVAVIETPRGLAALVMVAATNVGNMTVSFDPMITTAVRRSGRHVREKVYDPPIEIKKGDEFGIFHMGSTVVMLYAPGVLEADASEFRGRRIKMGQSL